MDRRRHLELQIRAVVVSLRAEQRRNSRTMGQFRDKARAILDSIEAEARRDPELATELKRARRELDRSGPSASSRFGQQTVDRGKKFLDREGLH